MSNLSNQQINSSFNGLLQVPGGITSSLQTVQDGNGNPTGLLLSSTGSNISSSNTFVASNNGITFANAVSRGIGDGFGDYISVKDFGAVGDGTTNDTTAIQNAITAVQNNGGGSVYFPAGTYIISSAITIETNAVHLIGAGNGNSAVPGIAASNVTTIKASATMSFMFKFLNINNGACGIENILLDGSSSLYPNTALIVDGVTGGFFKNLGILNAYNVGVQLAATSATCSWNTFINLTCNQLQGVAAVYLSGFTGQANACHNTFITSRIAFAGAAHGIKLGGCDNNTFQMTFIFASGSPTGYGVYCDPTEQAGFPGQNTFFHLQASTRGWYQPSTVVPITARVYSYQQDNGQPVPIAPLTTTYYPGSIAATFDNIKMPLTLVASSGFGGGTPTITGYYVVSGNILSIHIEISGTGVTGSSAQITGIPNYISFTPLIGFSTASGGVNVPGYIVNGTAVISGFASTNSVVFNAISALS
tara:strand:- start:267 stop:1694 length:1428 start_codon:yes stop_codon:yes gene_type:complete